MMTHCPFTHAGVWKGRSIRHGCFFPPSVLTYLFYHSTFTSRCRSVRNSVEHRWQEIPVKWQWLCPNHKTVRVDATGLAGELMDSTLTSQPASVLKSEQLHETSVKTLLWFSELTVVGSDLLRRGFPNKFWVVFGLRNPAKTFFASNGFKAPVGFT